MDLMANDIILQMEYFYVIFYANYALNFEPFEIIFVRIDCQYIESQIQSHLFPIFSFSSAALVDNTSYYLVTCNLVIKIILNDFEPRQILREDYSCHCTFIVCEPQMMIFQYSAPNIWPLGIACCLRLFVINLSRAKQMLMCPASCFSSCTISNLRSMCHYFSFTAYLVSLKALSFLKSVQIVF